MSIVGIFVNAQPQIGGLVFDATLEESTELTTEVTQFPVESGVVGNDHAVQRPLSLTMRIGVSDNPFRSLRSLAGEAGGLAMSTATGVVVGSMSRDTAVAAGLAATAINAGFSAGQAATRSQQALEDLRELQRTQQIVDVVANSTSYEGCLISSTRQETNKENEQGVEIIVDLTQLIVAETPAGGQDVPAVGDSAETQAAPLTDLGVISPR